MAGTRICRFYSYSNQVQCGVDVGGELWCSQAIHAALRCSLIDYEPESVDASQETSITRINTKRAILTVDGDGKGSCRSQQNPLNMRVLEPVDDGVGMRRVVSGCLDERKEAERPLSVFRKRFAGA